MSKMSEIAMEHKKRDQSEYNKKYYAKNKERENARAKAWREANREKIKEYNKKYKTSHKELVNSLLKKDKAKHSEEHKIRKRICEAIRRGSLERQPCEVCGSMPTEAHHDNYNEPYNITWLCRRHHVDWHKKNNPIRVGERS
jgi:hypothetical protein